MNLIGSVVELKIYIRVQEEDIIRVQEEFVQIEKFFCSSSTTPKPQINYFNKQYHLLVSNKHQKLLTYCLFEGLIKDLETD